MTKLSALSADRHWSECYRKAALAWADLDSAARLLEETKSAVFAQQKTRIIREANESLSEAKAERLARSDPEWMEHIQKVCNAKSAAAKARIEVDFIKMRAMEEQSANADKRAEMRL